MKGRQFVRRLRRAGAEVIEGRGKGGHMLAKYQGNQATIPFHGDRDLSPAFLKMLCRQLGIDPKEVL
ncbi:MAG: type II toxin-antitoxin system HicA family toxin [Desulfarculaceae bacterium]|jgi:predicted RNA binding protein YcfA (HicA-like mRNA interferase family)